MADGQKAEALRQTPRLIGGKGRAPPDDVGGEPGFRCFQGRAPGDRMTPEEAERLAAIHRRVGAAFKPIFVPSQPPDPDALDLSALKVLLAEEEVYASPPQEARHLADRERL